MENILLDNRSQKMNAYLNDQGPYPFSDRAYRFLVLKMASNDDEKMIIAFLNEFLFEACFLKFNNEIIVFYFEEYDFKHIMSSMSDDFSTRFSCFQSGKIYPKSPQAFYTILNCFHKHYQVKPFVFVDIADLIFEVVKSDVEQLKQLKPIILNRVYGDSQLERLMEAVLENDLNVTKAAQSVYMHRNTAINKLEFIKAETGLNIQHFKHAACMYWLLHTK
jgi:sugar diacid utilization regulator